ncbi:MAG: virulence RhuM family protein [FCB group bacterium]|jgi:hypothetical protein|nr:virulence RhuM family protein [FCB group bacterium]
MTDRERNEPVPQGEIVLYQTADGRTRVECRFADESIWLTQRLMAELFQVGVNTINYHLKEIFEEGELVPEATIRQYRIVQLEGTREVSREVEHYNLDAVLAVGYRVRSARGTAFRQWATARLGEYLLKGFALDDERLKNPPGPGVPDYFDEMLERIRDIRSSERRMYLQVRNVLALAADYDPSDEETQHFFQVVQNKLHFAATGKTAPELIVERADHTKPNMNLSTWKGQVVRKGDVTVAKNYLHEDEIAELNRIVVMFLDFAEDQARRRRQVFVRDWRERLDDFLRFNEREVLPGLGHVSREEADRRAVEEYELFHRRRLAEADAQAEADTMKQLEEMAKSLPKRKKSRKRSTD